MCLGRGSDPNAFQPNRDESQWWLRRDSLVRVAASFLFDNDVINKELILLFEEDYARMEMKRSRNTKVEYPTEQRLVGLWKAAALAPGTLLDRYGISCRLVLDPNTPIAKLQSFDGKRQVLDFLQKNSSLDFLRQHRLNADPAVVLRKTNKQTLEKIYSEWAASSQTTQSNGDGPDSQNVKHSRLAAIYKIILQPLVDSCQVLAGILHESCNSELPCWGTTLTHEQQPPPPPPSSSSHHNLQLCLFLGAVRDMHPYENRILQECHPLLLRVRLGPVPEFTSKILSIVGYHFEHGRLGSAMMVQLRNITSTRSKTIIPSKTNEISHASRNNKRDMENYPSELHVVALVPIPSTQLSSRLQDRSRVLWCLVRLIVNTLWRSRLASADHDDGYPLENTLTLVFSDHLCLRLEQEEWVKTLAEQHQAAPSEHQILAALCCQTAKQYPTTRTDDVTQSIQTLLDGAACLVEIQTGGDPVLARTSYSIPPMPDGHHAGRVVALLRIRSGDDGTITTEWARTQTKAIRKLCQARNVPVVKTSLSSSNEPDAEGMAVIVLQHLCYQNRLLPAIEKLMDHMTSQKTKKKRQ